jgi:formylglycine-generating enzyme required for sulfatase activity
MRYPDLGFRCCRGEAEIDNMYQAWSNDQTSCPEQMAHMGSFCMDIHEYPNNKGSVPLGNLDYLEARKVCESLDKRVCTEAEWAMACSGPNWRGYPYGNYYASGRCAIRDDGRIGGRIAASGAYPGCSTPEGVLDLSGNLWEWVETATEEGVLRGAGRHLSAGMGRCRSRALATDEFSTAEAGTRCCVDIPSLP